VPDLASVLATYVPQSEAESADVARLRRLVAETDDPWTRASALHVTGSAVVVHPPTGRVLLRWHERMQAWLQVGGHGDPGETNPFEIALREGAEETGLTDLAGWPEPEHVVHVAVVPVTAGKGEPEHEHGDIRYALATMQPESVTPENEAARLVWLEVDEAIQRVGWDNLRTCLSRIASLLRERGPAPTR
jgi:8-oxo-dGTP pyrophosphatase MutT (NUDIX family)